MQEKSGGVGCLGTYLTARVRVAHITRVGHGENRIQVDREDWGGVIAEMREWVSSFE